MSFLLTFCFVAFCTLQTISCDDDILVEIEQGTLRGKQQDAVCGGYSYYSFEGIPYAAPPVGSLRFLAPQEPSSWNGTRNATALGPMCPQYNMLSGVYTAGSEDCLTVNIYTRNLTASTPVLVFISGFAYRFDADDVDLYGADFMVKDLVVVTFNYRQDALGFLNLNIPEVPGNAGLKDQNAALKWVKKNIASFGGDPDRVTLGGISAGSASVIQHMMSEMSSNLFHRAIMISGVPSCDPIYAYKVEEKSYLLGKLLGLDTKNGTELLIYLQSLDYEELINKTCSILASEIVTTELFKKMSPFVPVAENDLGQERFLTVNIVDEVATVLINKVPVMVGYCDHEGLLAVNDFAEYLMEKYDRYRELFVPNKILYRVTPDVALEYADIIKEYYLGNKTVSMENIEEMVQCSGDSCMVYDVLKFTKALSLFTDTRLFKFSSSSSRNYYGNQGVQYGVEGVSHADPIFYMFQPKSMNMTVNCSSTEYTMIQQFVDSLTNYAIYGDPTPDADEDSAWRLFTTDSMYYVEYTDTMTVKQDPDSKKYQFWHGIYTSLNYDIFPGKP